MAISRQQDSRGSRAFAYPLFWIVLLLASYLLLADWKHVPALIGDALATLHWFS